MTDFESKVYAVTRRIPQGQVATYGQIAAAVGCPGGARAVGNALHRNPDPKTPCFRVVTAEGKLSKAFGFGGVFTQREWLDADGIVVINFRVDLQEYQCEDASLIE